MKKTKIDLLFRSLGISYAISAVIIVLTTINRVLVAFSYSLSCRLRVATYLDMFCFYISRIRARGGSVNW